MKNYLNHLAEKMLSLEYYLSLKYPMSIYPEEDGGYTVMIPDLPGCMIQGDNLEEAIENINEARELWIETVYCSGKQQIHTKTYQRWFSLDMRKLAINQALSKRNEVELIKDENTGLKMENERLKIEVEKLRMEMVYKRS